MQVDALSDSQGLGVLPGGLAEIRFAPRHPGLLLPVVMLVCMKVRRCYVRPQTGIETGKLSCKVALFNDLSKKKKI